MTNATKLRIGATLEDDLDSFRQAWKSAEAGDADTQPERILSFESWEALATVLTAERYRLLRHVHAHPQKSISALSAALERQYRRVHEDVTVLERAGLLDRSDGGVRATVDRIVAEVIL